MITAFVIEESVLDRGAMVIGEIKKHWTQHFSPAGILIAGGTGEAGDRVEVFHPYSNQTCALSNLPPLEDRSQSTLCSGLLCGGLAGSASRSCLRFDEGQFKKTNVTLQQNRSQDLCWKQDNGALLLGGPGGGSASLRSSELLQPDGSSSSPSFDLVYNIE